MVRDVRRSPSLLYFVVTVFRSNVRIENIPKKHERWLRFWNYSRNLYHRLDLRRRWE